MVSAAGGTVDAGAREAGAPPLLIVGASARAAAQSALRAGYRPWCVDLFGDVDLRQSAACVVCPRADYPRHLPAMLARLLTQVTAAIPAGAEPRPSTATIPASPSGAHASHPHRPTPMALPPHPAATVRPPALLLTGAMENHLATVRALAQCCPLLHGEPVALQRARRLDLARCLPPLPGVRWPVIILPHAPLPTAGPWLCKPRHSAGGNRIAPWPPTAPDANPNKRDRSNFPPPAIPRRCVLQQHISGQSWSAIYHADDRGCRLLGVTRQLIGASWCHGAGYRYCGTLAGSAIAEQLPTSVRIALAALGEALVQYTTLRGPFGIDFILDRQQTVWPVEVNPRYTAGMEVLEHASQLCVLRPDHAPGSPGSSSSPGSPGTAAPCHGKVICYAPADVIMPAPADWASALPAGVESADVPHADESILRGWPICTLLTAGPSAAAVLARLREAAAALYTRLLTPALLG